jgi:hypothetical protein
MKTIAFRMALALIVLGLSVAPITAAPLCEECNCQHSCWTLCYDEGGSNACQAYICSGHPGCRNLTSTASADELLRAITAPAGQTPAVTSASDAACLR